jgi:predicted dehydrogenase
MRQSQCRRKAALALGARIISCLYWARKVGCRFQFPFAHARPTACQIELGDDTSVGAFPTRIIKAANQYLLEVERFSKLLLGESVPRWPIEDSLDTLRTIEAIFESAPTGQWQALR